METTEFLNEPTKTQNSDKYSANHLIKINVIADNEHAITFYKSLNLDKKTVNVYADPENKKHWMGITHLSYDDMEILDYLFNPRHGKENGDSSFNCKQDDGWTPENKKVRATGPHLLN